MSGSPLPWPTKQVCIKCPFTQDLSSSPTNLYIYIIQVIFTSETKRVLYHKGADIPVDGQLNEGTWILIQICFVDQHGVGPLISYIYIYIYIYIYM